MSTGCHFKCSGMLNTITEDIELINLFSVPHTCLSLVGSFIPAEIIYTFPVLCSSVIIKWKSQTTEP